MSEDTPVRNVVRVMLDGPFLVYGDVEVQAPDGTTLRTGSQVALCRCGASGTKPFCDGSHAGVEFTDAATVQGIASHKPDPATATGRVVARAAAEGPLIVSGSFDLEGETGLLGFREGKAALCACGRSATKPLCDGAHAHPAE